MVAYRNTNILLHLGSAAAEPTLGKMGLPKTKKMETAGFQHCFVRTMEQTSHMMAHRTW